MGKRNRLQSCKFFIRSLTTLRADQLGDLIESYKQDSVTLKEHILELCLYMAGGVDLNSAWGMSFEDREIAIRVINKQLKNRAPKGGKEFM